MAVLSPAAAVVLRPTTTSSAGAAPSFSCPPFAGPARQKQPRVRYSFSSVSAIPKAPTTSSQSAGIFTMRGAILRIYRTISSVLAFDRRELLLISTLGPFVYPFLNVLDNGKAVAAEFADMPALRGKDYGKTKMRYPDYTETQSGLQYKDLRLGDGPKPRMGETVVVDWDGYTIGYYGRIFEARNKTKGGSFEGEDKEFLKFKLGSQQVIPAFEEAVTGMAPGGIRRLSSKTPDNGIFNRLYRIALSCRFNTSKSVLNVFIFQNPSHNTIVLCIHVYHGFPFDMVPLIYCHGSFTNSFSKQVSYDNFVRITSRATVKSTS